MSTKYETRLTIHKTKDILFEISKIITISQKSRDKWMTNPVIHDFVILVFVYVKLIKSKGLKKRGIDSLLQLFNERMPEHKEYFEKNDVICESYKFTNKIVNYFCNKYRK